LEQFIASPVQDLVNAERGVVERRAFFDDEVHRDEVARIFNRTWGFLAHESEIPSPGDYVVRPLGSAQVIVLRDADGGVRALLNSCRHRGAKLCRADSGSVRRFVCPYHGWTYDRDGKLLTTTYDHYLPPDLDHATLSLFPVPRVESFCGLIFGCWNAEIAPLEAYLDDLGWYLKALLARTPRGMQVLAPPHRWRTRANWKIGALNFIGDSQHILTTHAGPLTLDPVRAANRGLAKPGPQSFQLVTGHGHGGTFTYLNTGLPEDAYRTHAAALLPLYDQTLDHAQRDMLRNLRVAVGTIFPNLSFIETQSGPEEKVVILRLWHPVSGSEMEISSWVLAECEASDDYKTHALRNGFRNFGAAGVFEQDDLELWESATSASSNPVASRLPYSFHTALPYLDKPDASHPWPGNAYRPSDTEVAQFAFMLHWQRLLRQETA
jgi:PAH dioxygenase large subunit